MVLNARQRRRRRGSVFASEAPQKLRPSRRSPSLAAAMLGCPIGSVFVLIANVFQALEAQWGRLGNWAFTTRTMQRGDRGRSLDRRTPAPPSHPRVIRLD